MPKKRARIVKEPKRKAVNYKLIPPMDGKHVPEPYLLLKEIREMHHGDTREARVALAWRLREKPDKDGHLVLGRCIKVSDLNKEFANWDFIITLNKEAWEDIEFDKKKKMALLDHEMMHAAVCFDEETGERKRDERERLIWRIRDHDLQEFNDIVERHGIWKRDIEKFAEVLLRKRSMAPLLPGLDAPEGTSSAIQ